MVCSNITDFDINEDKIADTMAIRVLGEIQQELLKDELDDFEMIDEIVSIFGRYKLNSGICHDF